MLEIFFTVLALIPTILGVAELLHSFKVCLLSSKKKPKKYLLIFLDNGYAKEQLSDAIEQYSWLGKRYSDEILAVYTELSEEERAFCEKMAEPFKITLCPIGDFCLFSIN